MPQIPTTLQTEYCLLAFHRKLKKNYLKCHNYRRLCRWTTVHGHFIENWKIITANATITDDFVDGKLPRYVVGGSILPTKSSTDCANSKGQCIKCITDRVRVLMELPIDREKFGGQLKTLVWNSKFSDGFSKLHRRNKLK